MSQDGTARSVMSMSSKRFVFEGSSVPNKVQASKEVSPAKYSVYSSHEPYSGFVRFRRVR
jgi:hypothetical protein